MKFSKILVIMFFAILLAQALHAQHSLGILVFDASELGNLVWTKTINDAVFEGETLSPDPIAIVREQSLGIETAYVQLIFDGEILDSHRIPVTMRSTSLRREHEPMDEMEMGIQIGEAGNDVGIRSDRLVVGAGDPNEKITVEGAVSIQEQDIPPGASAGFGKIFIDNTDNHLYYIDEAGTITDLTVDANAVQSVSSSANHTGRMDHMRFIPGEATEITESATDDTIYIRYDVNVSSSGPSPCTSAPAAPTFIDGNALACSGEPGTSYSTLMVPGADYYRWSLPTGSSILTGSGTNSIRVMFGSSDGNICVSALNGCGESSSYCMPVTINRPTSPGSISGTALVCRNQTGVTYSIATVPDATNYNWTVPPGASIVSGSSTPTILINFGTSPGEVCVSTENSCGTSAPVCMTVDMTWTPSTPGAISGITDVCPGATGVTYSISSVAEATSYNWSLPTGSSIASGDGTTAIDVNFGTSSGDICVEATNSCGTSSARCVSINIMTPPTITSHPSNTTVDEGDPANFSITASGDGLVYQWQQSIDSGSSWSNVGSGGTSYSIGSTTASMDDYQYRCIVTGTCTPAETSSVAILTVATGLYEFTSHTFTPCGATGRNGPTLTQCRSAYDPVDDWDENPSYFNVSSGIQEWVVPRTGNYQISARGSRSGYHPSYTISSGKGAIMQGTFALTAGDVIRILVGQEGGYESGYSDTYYAAGGGGASFVTTITNSPLIIAGGGGGPSDDYAGSDAITSETGTHTGSAGAGGTSDAGNSGAGLNGNGTVGSHGGISALSFINGGTGGLGDSGGGAGYGGFGGGGGDGYAEGGGGGGYSGGDGPDDHMTAYGGGSYNAGTSPSNSIGNDGPGEVTITYLP